MAVEFPESPDFPAARNALTALTSSTIVKMLLPIKSSREIILRTRTALSAMKMSVDE